MAIRFALILITYIITGTLFAKASGKPGAAVVTFFTADNPAIQYTGRIDFSNPKRPRFWQPGVYITIRFKGPSCSFIVNDEVLWGNSHNYIEVVVDKNAPVRLQTKNKTDTIVAAKGLSDGIHTLVICKNTEAGIGYLEFVGVQCAALLPALPKPARKIEFIGNSITCGAGMDLSVIPCDKGQWYDQHNAYMSYGAVTARALQAQWHLSSVSGIGLIHSCCNMKITMPPVFDKVNMRTDSIQWDFKKYQPDVVTVCLGQNDGIQDSITFCGDYVIFLEQIRNNYPSANIVLLTSPMADERLSAVMKKYIPGIVKYINAAGDKNVYYYFFSRRFHNGCGGHPDLQDHQLIAAELTKFLKGLMHW